MFYGFGLGLGFILGVVDVFMRLGKGLGVRWGFVWGWLGVWVFSSFGWRFGDVEHPMIHGGSTYGAPITVVR